MKIMEENHYYPFGLKHGSYNTGLNDFQRQESAVVLKAPVNPNPGDGDVLANSFKYRYNGKEFQEELGLNMYDMDIRQYDPAIGRWVVQDPVVHHDMSPYNAFDNNPVFWADPSGADSQTGQTDSNGSNRFDALGQYIPPLERFVRPRPFDNADEDRYRRNVSGGPPDDVTVNSKGIVTKIVKNGKANRFFDETGQELFFNDPSSDSQWYNSIELGDRLYHKIGEATYLRMIMKAGVNHPLFRGPFKTLFDSYYDADFGTSQISPEFGIPYNTTEYDGVEGGDGSFYRFGNDKSIYNLADAGNFMWGGWMRANLQSLGLSTWSANINSIMSINGPDTKSDQQAITKGHNYMTNYLKSLRKK